MQDISEDILEELSQSSVPPPTSDTREPSPAVVARAKQIVAEIKGGDTFSKVENDIPWKTKLSFLAHVLEGENFEQTYSVFGGKLRITFRALPASWEAAVVSYAATAPESERKAVYHRTLALLSLAKLDRVERPLSTDDLSRYRPEQVKDLSERLLQHLSRTELTLVETHFREFRKLLNSLLEKADTPSFWEPLS